MPAAQASQTRTEFLLVADPALGLETDQIPLENGRWTIGSGDENRIVAKGPGVDEQHCLILVRSEQLLMKSWGQRTLVNGAETSEAFLNAGDVLTLGESDFQIRHDRPAESDDQAESIAHRIETLSGIVEELDKELSGRQANVDRLDATIVRIQSNLEDRAGSESTVARLRSQIDSLQASVVPEGISESEESESPAEASASDLRVETAQQNLDTILNEVEESEQNSDAAYELQLSMRIEQQLRQLETVSASLENRAAVLEQQALELQGQRASVSHRPSEEHHTPAASLSFEDQQASEDQLAADEVTAGEAVPEPDGHDVSGHDEAAGSSAHDAAPSEDTLNSYVSEQRQKLQMLMDDFEPFQQTSSDHDEEVTVSESVLEEIRTTLAEEESLESQDAEEHSESEIREAVTAAVIDGSSQLGEVTAARRSRDEAIRQLDDLIRFAADESLCDVPTPTLPEPSAGPEGCSTISNFDVVSGADTVVEGETAWATSAGLETDLEEESVIDEADQAEVSQSEIASGDSFDAPASAEDSIEATFDFATEQLAAFSENNEPETDSHDRTLTELEFETGAASTLVESGLTADDAVPEEDAVAEDPEQESEFPSGFSWATTTPVEATADQSSEGDATPDEADIEDTWREEDSEFSPSSAAAALEESSITEEATRPADDSGSEPADSSSDSPESRVQELRTQLAQMFDLPEDASADLEPSPDAAAPQTSLWESTLPSKHETETADDESPEATGLGLGLETDNDVPADASTSETETEPNVESTEPTEAESQEASSDELDADDPNSIDAYMQQLLARNRQINGVPATPEPVPRPEPAKETSSDTVTESSKDDDKKDGQTWLTEGPKHRQDREAVRASLTTLREVANQSARSAVAQAGRTQLRREILTLTAASLICLVFAVAAALLKINPLLPLGAVGVSLFFAVKLGIEIRRSSALLRQSKAESGIEKSEDKPAITPDEVIVEAESD